MTIITGADSRFFYSMLQLINSINIHESGRHKIVVYDLGLSEAQFDWLKKQYPTIILKKFDYSKYPPHFSISANSGNYAWKPQIIYDEFIIDDGYPFIFWLDAGCVVKRQMLLIRAALYFFGFYSVLSGPVIKEYTHEKTISLLDLKQQSNLKMLSGGIIGFNKRSDKNILLLSEWVHAAKNPEIIAPTGSSKDNHRYDQSIVSMLFYKIYGVKKQPIISRKGFEILAHKYIG